MKYQQVAFKAVASLAVVACAVAMADWDHQSVYKEWNFWMGTDSLKHNIAQHCH